ncbi:MAG: hypothetical protein RR140_00215 [Clostridia bacterium]
MKKYFGIFFFTLVMVVVSVVQPAFASPKIDVNPLPDPPVFDPDTEKPKQDMPVFKNAIDAWEYAYNYMNKCKGYEFTAVTAAKAKVTVGITVVQTQNIVMVKKVSGGKSFQTTYTQCDLPVGNNDYSMIFVENGLVTYRITSNKNYNKETNLCKFDNNKSVSKYEDHLLYCPIGDKDFTFGINKKTAKQVSFRASKNKTYEFTISIDGDKLEPTYLNYVKLMAGATEFNYDRMILTVVMSSTTGRFISINRQEFYTMVARGFTLELDQTVNSTFTKFDEAFEVVNLYP